MLCRLRLSSCLANCPGGYIRACMRTSRLFQPVHQLLLLCVRVVCACVCVCLRNWGLWSCVAPLC